MAKLSEAEEIAAFKREVADHKHRLALLEAFVDARHRKKLGLTTDDIRAAWHGKIEPPNFGAV